MRMKLSYLGLIIFVMLLLISGCAKEQEIGVLDMEKILDNSQRAKQLTGNLTQIGNELEKQYDEAEKALEDEDSKQKELDRIYQQFLNNKKDYENKLNQEINQVLADISESENLDIIIFKKYTRFGGTDITDKTIEVLDDTFYDKGGELNNGEESSL